MKPDKIEEALQALHREAGAAPPDHRERLEARLLARFDEMNAPEEKRPMFGFRFPLRPVAVAAVVLLGLGLASQAPADYSVEVGKSIDISLDGDGPLPDVQAMVGKLTAANASRLEVTAGIRREAQSTVIRLELWGDTVPLTDLESTLRGGFPELALARMSVGTVTGPVHSTVGGLLLHNVRSLLEKATTPEEIAAARAAIQDALRAQGEDGDVDVEVEGQGDDRKVKVKVEKREVQEVP